MDCRLKSPDFIHAVLSLKQLKSGDELEWLEPLCVSGLFFSGRGGSGDISFFLSFSLHAPFLSSCLSPPLYLFLSDFDQQFVV